MALSQQVYSPDYPSNTKQVTIDLTSRVPVGGSGDEKYILTVYVSSSVVGANSSTISPIYINDMKRGWAQSHPVAFPVSTAGGTLTVAIDDATEDAVTLNVPSGVLSASVLTANLQNQLYNTAVSGGAKWTATNRLSYMNSEVSYQDGRLAIFSGSTKESFNSSDWTKTSSVKVTGGTAANALGFANGYPNSYDLAATSSGTLFGPASAHVTFDDAVRFAVMSIVNQIDFSVS